MFRRKPQAPASLPARFWWAREGWVEARLDASRAGAKVILAQIALRQIAASTVADSYSKKRAEAALEDMERVR